MSGVVQLAVFLCRAYPPHLIRDLQLQLVSKCTVNQSFIVCGGTRVVDLLELVPCLGDGLLQWDHIAPPPSPQGGGGVSTVPPPRETPPGACCMSP